MYGDVALHPTSVAATASPASDALAPSERIMIELRR
jgi:hypothetical protein